MQGMRVRNHSHASHPQGALACAFCAMAAHPRTLAAMRPKSSLPPKKKPAVVAVRGPAAHEIRIIGGQWRRTPIKVLDKPGLRPTPCLLYTSDAADD